MKAHVPKPAPVDKPGSVGEMQKAAAEVAAVLQSQAAVAAGRRPAVVVAEQNQSLDRQKTGPADQRRRTPLRVEAGHHSRSSQTLEVARAQPQDIPAGGERHKHADRAGSGADRTNTLGACRLIECDAM